MKKPTLFNKAGYATLLALVVVSALLFGAVHQAILASVYVGIGMICICLALDWQSTKRIRLSNEPMQLVLFAAGAYGLIQVIPFGEVAPIAGVSGIPRTISYEPFATKVSALHFLILGLFFSAACLVLDSIERVRKLIALSMLFGSVYAFFAIIQFVVSPTKIYGLLDVSGAQPFGSFMSRNNFAAWMEMAVALPVGLLFAGAAEKGKRLIYVTAAVIMGVSIAVCGSRGGLMVLVVQLIFVSILTLSGSSGAKLLLRVGLGAGMLAAIVAGTAFVGGENTLTRINDESAAQSEISVTRPHIWLTTMKMIGSNVPLGVGLGAFGTAYTRYDQASGIERAEQAHNDYLQVLSDAGIPGGVLGLTFLFLLYRAARRALAIRERESRAYAVAALTGVVGVLAHSVVDFPLHTTAIALFFLTMTAVVVACASASSEVGSRVRGRESQGRAPAR